MGLIHSGGSTCIMLTNVYFPIQPQSKQILLLPLASLCLRLSGWSASEQIFRLTEEDVMLRSHSSLSPLDLQYIIQMGTDSIVRCTPDAAL